MPTIDTLCNWARQSLKAGSFDRSIGLCRHVLRFFPKSIEAHCVLGEVYSEMENTAEAERYFKLVLSADPESVPALVGLGVAYRQQGQAEAAMVEFERALELQPENPRLRKEIRRLSNLLAGPPVDRVKPTRGMLGRIYLRSELYDRAARELRVVYDADPTRLDIGVGLAESLWRAGQFAQAVQVCRSVLSIAPDCLKAKLLLADMALAGHMSGNPGSLSAEARGLDPENTMAAALFAESANSNRWLAHPSDLPLPDERDLVADIEEEAAGDDRYEEQEESRVEASAPASAAPPAGAEIDEAESASLRALKTADLRLAVARWRSALVVNTADHATRLSLAKALARLGEVDGAVHELDYLAASAPELARQMRLGVKELLDQGIVHPRLHRLLADAYMNDGAFSEAIEQYTLAMELESKGQNQSG